MRRNQGRRGPGRPPKKKPSADSMLKDLKEIAKAINTVRRIANLPGMKSILTSLYGEKRFAEQLLAKNYPRIAKRVTRVTATRMRRKASEETRRSPPATSERERTTKGEKIARGWRFAGAIKENYANHPVIAKMSKADIRREHGRLRRGLKTRIPDIIFRNPSP